MVGNNTQGNVAPIPMHPAVIEILSFFSYSHLPPHLQTISKPFHDIAAEMAENLTGAEVTVGLRKLLEAKDCMVRASVAMNRK